MPNRNYGFPSELSLQNQCYTPPFPTQFYPQTIILLSVCDSSRSSQFTLLFWGVRSVMKHAPTIAKRKSNPIKRLTVSLEEQTKNEKTITRRCVSLSYRFMFYGVFGTLEASNGRYLATENQYRFIALSISRRSSFSFNVWRLSYSFLPRHSAMSTFARPCWSINTSVGTMV